MLVNPTNFVEARQLIPLLLPHSRSIIVVNRLDMGQIHLLSLVGSANSSRKTWYRNFGTICLDLTVKGTSVM